MVAIREPGWEQGGVRERFWGWFVRLLSCYCRHMTVVLGHSSAWQYWLHTGVPSVHSDSPQLFALPFNDMTCEDLVNQYAPRIDGPTHKELEALAINLDNLHITVCNPSHRRRLANTCCHQETYKLPKDSILRVSEHVYVARPELVFLQKAAEGSYSLERLVLLGYGICGRFAFSPFTHDNAGLIQVYERATVESVNEYLDAFERANNQLGHLPRGISRARRAMRRVLGSVESPQEARIAMLEFMDAHLGGNAIKAPECNGRVELSSEQMRATGRSYFRCDFLWREERVVLEYNGTHHGEAREVNRDAEKYNALSDAGYEVILASWKHIEDRVHTDVLANQLRAALNQSAPRTRYDHRDRQTRLRKELQLRI